MSHLRTIGSLFSGIGGLDLGLERAGLGRIAWQCEIDPFCRRVLARHWPEVRIYEDVREVGHDAARVDVLCGGFPCTDLSHAARGRARAGLAGDASGLWYEMLRIVGELGPRVVVIENVADAWRQWLPVVRRDLWDLGYASVPIRVRAADVGCPMGRPRVFVVAHANRDGERLVPIHAEVARASSALAADSAWQTDPRDAARVADGSAYRVDRRRALGNAVVPQCAEVVGRAILEHIARAA